MHLTLSHNRRWAWRKQHEFMGSRITERHKKKILICPVPITSLVSLIYIYETLPEY